MSMRITFWGTRGSVPVASKNQMVYGGNTTSVQVESDCLPENHRLVLDAGSGFVPFSKELMASGVDLNDLTVHLLFTHYHHDHTQGLLLSPLTFIPSVAMRLYGPVEHKIGPKEMMRDMMRPPYFPLDFKSVAAHFKFKSFDLPETHVLIFHPKGVRAMTFDQFTQMVQDHGHVPVGKTGRYPVEECLVVKMFKSNHPERTISYRFEEGPTEKVFVFLTDHENQPGVPNGLRDHVRNADFLVLDSQYDQATYENRTCGFGHGTGAYCAWLAHCCLAKRLGLTHHDPFNADGKVDAIVAEAQAELKKLNTGAEAIHLHEDNVFACKDYQTVDV